MLTETQYQPAAVRQEIDISKQLRHRHIIQFYRETYHEGRLVIIMHYAERGSLRKVIERGNVFTLAVKKRIAQEIVRGLAYMHQQKVLHRDLKSENILLDQNYVVKICDFGLATVKALVPADSAESELFGDKPQHTNKSDMYALGWIIWEMAANSTPPFKEQLDPLMVISLVRSGKRGTIPQGTPEDYRKWIERCWDQDPLKRSETREMIDLTEEPNVPLELDVPEETIFDHVAGSSNAQISSHSSGFLSLSFASSSLGSHASTPSVPLETLSTRATTINIVDLELLAICGDKLAQYDLGILLLKDDSPARNVQEAVHWLKSAANQGHRQAHDKLEELKRQGVLQNSTANPSAGNASLHPAWEASSVAGLIKDIEWRQPLMKFHSKDMASLMSLSKDVATRYPNSAELSKILMEARILAVKLSTLGAAALLKAEAVLRHFTDLKTRLSKVKA
ncbi:hypothetical protein BGZ73_000410 [Actinomortierella ambigua]|nr:hypothetical protein BGZ73_000410 [Actinomortierella ambigua]